MVSSEHFPKKCRNTESNGAIVGGWIKAGHETENLVDEYFLEEMVGKLV